MTRLDQITRRQRGVVARSQVFDAGLTPAALRHRLDSGRWQRVFDGVYATFTGGVPPPARRWAAVLWAGHDAVLSHRSAAEEAGLADHPAGLGDHPAGLGGHADVGPTASSGGTIHITIPERRRVRPTPGIVVHRSRQLARRRHPTRRPPQTRVEETVLDLALTATSDETAMAWIAAACTRRLTTPDRVAKALAARHRVPHRRDLAALLDDVRSGCHSVLEHRYLRHVERAHDLPTGVRQRRRPEATTTRYDDVTYTDFGVLVELDGLAAHPPELRWRDFRRDNAAAEHGEVVLRYGTSDIREHPCEVAHQVATVLRSRGWDGVAAPCSPTCDTLLPGPTPPRPEPP
ncbi:type IV toxin-antitoxin system AbiEi family antitoxin domain-containing protein [Actinoplanes sp. NPDC051861]|uniref:type IV toxin-antitoxin system AbiEi family antitoxin domain-containing protein n=1 Tax=Actinoplanes sp. NPDC051861 TaxID=3155170 RepID=UPI003446FB4C